MEWIKCSDIMPNQNTKVLVFCPSDGILTSGVMLADWYDSKNGPFWWCPCRQTNEIKPSHWMHIPKDPKD